MWVESMTKYLVKEAFKKLIMKQKGIFTRDDIYNLAKRNNQTNSEITYRAITELVEEKRIKVVKAEDGSDLYKIRV